MNQCEAPALECASVPCRAINALLCVEVVKRKHMPRKPARPPSLRWIAFIVCCWIAFVFFGSWFPFDFRFLSTEDAIDGLNQSLDKNLSFSDVLVNLAVGVPTGALVAFYYSTRKQTKLDSWNAPWRLAASAIGGLAGALIAIPVEFGQMFLGSRDSSWFDVLAQTAGASIASLIVIVRIDECTSVCDSAYRAWKRNPASFRYLAPMALLYVLLQTWPWIPAISPSEIAIKLREIRDDLEGYRIGKASFGMSKELWPQLLGVGVCAIPFGFILSGVLMRNCSIKSLFISGIIAVLVTSSFELGKLFIETRNISFEGAAGSLIGMFLGMLIFRGRGRLVGSEAESMARG
jgi:VanZ family protein